VTTRVLFLYVSASSGHQRAADAVREALTLVTPGWETVGVDAFTYVYPTIGRLVSRTYLEILQRTPALWDFIYDNPDVEHATREARELLNLMSSRKMKKLVGRHSPAAIVCTQAAPCSVFAAEKRRGRLAGIPLIAVITDFAVHSYWVYNEVDLYCVPSEEVRKTLVKQGILAARIVVTGIPISPVFLQRVPKERVLASMKLDPKRKTILVMGGSQGMGPMEELIGRLIPLDVQILVLTGLNRDLFRQLSKRYGREKRVRILGYTKTVHRLMDAADLLITKPGGLTSSEALAKGLPMIISNPIPGQEERNAAYLIRQGVAERADDPVEAANVTAGLLRNPAKWRRMGERTQAVAMPYAAIEVARHIFRLAHTVATK
jgi:processive 1,2-diacylglycerol beta-glucosyltransferase